MFQCLTDEHPVKGITMNRRESRKLPDTGLVQRQIGNLMAYALGRQILFWRFR